MNARLLRRFMLTAGTAALVGTSVYAMAGTSIGASAPHPAKAAAASAAPVEVKLFKEVQVREHGRIKHVRKLVKVEAAKIKSVSAADVSKAGASPSNLTSDPTAGPGSVCLAYVDQSPVSMVAGEYTVASFLFSSAPVIVSSMFDQTTFTNFSPYLVEAIGQAPANSYGDAVAVTITNISSSDVTFDGEYGVLYLASSTGC